MRLTDAEARRLGLDVPKRAKYGNCKTEYQGVLYDSALEAACAAELDRLMTLGYVRSWSRQVPYALPAGVSYRADFVVDYATGAPRVIDAKGAETPVFRLKRRLFEAQHGPLDVVRHWRDLPREGR